jgi:hypothetical protein
MKDRRIKRSADRSEALQFLVECVADRSRASSAVLVDDSGRIVAGMGMPGEVMGLARAARRVAWGTAAEADLDAVGGHRDVTARTVSTGAGTFHLAAVCDRLASVGDAARAVARIVG